MCARMCAKRNYWKWKFSSRHSFQIQIYCLYLHKLAVAHRHFANFIKILCWNLSIFSQKVGNCSLLVFLSQSSWDKLALTQILRIQLLGDPLMMGDGDRKDCFTDINIFLPRSLPMCREYCIREHCWRDQREKEGEQIPPVEALSTILLLIISSLYCYIIHYLYCWGDQGEDERGDTTSRGPGHFDMSVRFGDDTGWFFLLVGPKKWLSVRLHCKSIKKVLSVRISYGSDT